MNIKLNLTPSQNLGRHALPEEAHKASAQGLPQDKFVPSETRGYAPENRLLWDSWFMQDKDGYRLYHLDAPMDPDPETRHERAQIRTAFSKDLVNWKDDGFALKSGPRGSWDDGPIWTGSTYKEDGTYYKFYTGRNHRDGQTQRIGLAKSTDGINWERGEKPLLEADSRWYETDEESPVYRAFRDPFIVKNPEDGKYLMYFTAKTKGGDPTYRGCVGLATADSMEGPWEQKPPVLAPGSIAEMECPQVLKKNDKWYMFITTKGANYSPERTEKVGSQQTGLHGWVSGSPTGPFEPVRGDGVISGNDSNMFSTRLVEDKDRPGEYNALGWYMGDREVLVDESKREAARETGRAAAGAAIGGVGGALIRVLEKGYTLSEPHPVVWDESGPRIETGRIFNSSVTK